MADLNNNGIDDAEEIQPLREPNVIVRQQTPTVSLIENFLSVLRGSWILQIGILFIFMSVGVHIITGGKLIILGFTVIDSHLTEADCEEYFTSNSYINTESKYSFIDTLERAK